MWKGLVLIIFFCSYGNFTYCKNTEVIRFSTHKRVFSVGERHIPKVLLIIHKLAKAKYELTRKPSGYHDHYYDFIAAAA